MKAADPGLSFEEKDQRYSAYFLRARTAEDLSKRRSQSQFRQALSMQEGLSILSEVMQEDWHVASVVPVDFVQGAKESIQFRKSRFKTLTSYESKVGKSEFKQ